MEWHLAVSLEGGEQTRVWSNGCPRRENWVAVEGREGWKTGDLKDPDTKF